MPNDKRKTLSLFFDLAKRLSRTKRKISQLWPGEAHIADQAQYIPASAWRSAYRGPSATYPSFGLAKRLSRTKRTISQLRPGEAPIADQAQYIPVLAWRNAYRGPSATYPSFGL